MHRKARTKFTAVCPRFPPHEEPGETPQPGLFPHVSGSSSELVPSDRGAAPATAPRTSCREASRDSSFSPPSPNPHILPDILCLQSCSSGFVATLRKFLSILSTTFNLAQFHIGFFKIRFLLPCSCNRHTELPLNTTAKSVRGL